MEKQGQSKGNDDDCVVPTCNKGTPQKRPRDDIDDDSDDDSNIDDDVDDVDDDNVNDVDAFTARRAEILQNFAYYHYETTISLWRLT